MAETKEKEHALMEGNLLEYPIFSMEKKRVGKTSKEYVWQERNGTGELTSERKFGVDCTAGLPNYFDMDVFNAIMRVYVRKCGLHKKTDVHFTIYELMGELKLPVHDGEKVNRVRKSLERMAKTNLYFENAFFAEKKRITKIVHLISRVEIYEQQKGNRLVNMIKVVLDDELVNSIERNYYKLIDYEVYNSLPSGLPRRLYEYLEKKKYRKNRFEIDIRKLAKRIPLKTSKISQLKNLLERANSKLKEKDVISKWEFNQKNVIYHFRKSKRSSEVEDNLSYLENLTVTFYRSLGQKKVSEVLIREGMNVLQNLMYEGYTKEEISFALGWAANNIKNIHSIRIIPKVIGQALGNKESRHLVEEKENSDQQKRLEEKKQIEEERKRGEELDKIFTTLPKQKQTALEQRARENLIQQGVRPAFLLPAVIRLERNKLLEKR